MGTYLAQPIKQKTLQQKESKKVGLKYTLCEMQGWRRFMEDKTITQLQIGDGNSIFAVFDGHGGSEVSSLLKEILVQKLISCKAYKQKKYTDAFIQVSKRIDKFIGSEEGEKRLQQIKRKNNMENKSTAPYTDRENIRKIQKSNGDSKNKYSLKSPHKRKSAIKLSQDSKSKITHRIDTKKQKKQKAQIISKISGCTAIMVLITPRKIVVANIGDSRCVLSRKGKAIPLSFDHKPENAIQYQRISIAGGLISKGRINDGLNLSRCFGDFNYKANPQLSAQQQMVVSIPEVITIERTSDDQFLLLGCDGVFEKYNFKEQSLITRIANESKTKKKKTEILSNLFDSLIAKDTKQIVGCDNMTAIIVEFI